MTELDKARAEVKRLEKLEALLQRAIDAQARYHGPGLSDEMLELRIADMETPPTFPGADLAQWQAERADYQAELVRRKVAPKLEYLTLEMGKRPLTESEIKFLQAHHTDNRFAFTALLDSVRVRFDKIEERLAALEAGAKPATDLGVGTGLEGEAEFKVIQRVTNHRVFPVKAFANNFVEYLRHMPKTSNISLGEEPNTMVAGNGENGFGKTVWVVRWQDGGQS